MFNVVAKKYFKKMLSDNSSKYYVHYFLYNSFTMPHARRTANSRLITARVNPAMKAAYLVSDIHRIPDIDRSKQNNTFSKLHLLCTEYASHQVLSGEPSHSTGWLMRFNR